MLNYKYKILIYKHELDDCEMLRYIEEDLSGYENRVVLVFSDGSYGCASHNFEFNANLSDCALPTVNEFYTSGDYDSNEADYHEITKEIFEQNWFKAIGFYNNII